MYTTPADRSTPAPHHTRRLPLRVGTRGSQLARVQTRNFFDILSTFCPVLARGIDGQPVFEEVVIRTTGDRVQDRALADLGGKGLFSKEIHEALLDRRIDFAVHSLKDLETELPQGIVLACTLKREDPRDVLILGPECGDPVPADPLASLPARAVIGTSALRRQAQLLNARPDLAITLMRGNIDSRLEKVEAGTCTASLLALAGLKRIGRENVKMAILSPEAMVPSACQGIVGVTVRAEDTHLHSLLAGIEDPEARAVSTAERTLLARLDGNCRTPIGGYARLLPTSKGEAPLLHLTGMVARADGSFLLKRSVHGGLADAARLGAELGASLRADSPSDIFG